MRPLPVTRAHRVARGFVLAVVTTSLAAAAHVLGGAELPSPTLLLVTTCLAAGLGVAFSGSRMGPTRVIAIVVAGQLLLHELLMLMVAVDTADPLRQQPVQDMPGMTMAAAPGAPSPWGAMLSHHAVMSVTTVPGATMLAGHALAAALVGVWLAAGERLVWSLLELLASGRRTASLMALAHAVVAHVRIGAGDDGPRAGLAQRLEPPWRPSTWFLVRAAGRRGPPRPIVPTLV